MNYDDWKLQAPPEGKPIEQPTKPQWNYQLADKFWDNIDYDRLHDINTLKLD